MLDQAERNRCDSKCNLWAFGVRVAPFRMGVRRAAPGSQVLSVFEVISCPWRAAFADQGSLYVPPFEKENKKVFELRFAVWRFCYFPEIFLFWIGTEKFFVSFLKRGQYELPWSAEAALEGQLITSESDRTWLPGSALLNPILKGATLSAPGWRSVAKFTATRQPPSHRSICSYCLLFLNFCWFFFPGWAPQRFWICQHSVNNIISQGDNVAKGLQRSPTNHAAWVNLDWGNTMHRVSCGLKEAFFLSFFLGWRIPNVITGLSGRGASN